MMSPTTSLGRPFSAESCASPVTSSRFMPASSPSSISGSGDKKSGVDPLSLAPEDVGQARRPLGNYIKLGSALQRAGRRAALCERIADVRKEFFDLVREEDL